MTELQVYLLVAPFVIFAVIGGGSYFMVKWIERQHPRSR
jgi:hypothetical protein